jgi:hypothetical protein
MKLTIQIKTPSFASWKTTLTGIASLLIGAMQTYHHTVILDALKDPQVLLALAVGLGLLFAKDGNVTGGTKGQPSSLEALSVANQAPAQGTVLINGVEAQVAPVPVPIPHQA